MGKNQLYNKQKTGLTCVVFHCLIFSLRPDASPVHSGERRVLRLRIRGHDQRVHLGQLRKEGDDHGRPHTQHFIPPGELLRNELSGLPDALLVSR